ncbi:hypothetical protein WN48_06365 [Eufriesea mexicana]|uniref:Uncharacterized protein n=1 Tax=Eufriesea mexicana TaxID=516756 RepID=A0A310SM78_9HYME|nr:hypothetical protein WN48_06365 [Eufriesea mexicana]
MTGGEEQAWHTDAPRVQTARSKVPIPVSLPSADVGGLSISGSTSTCSLVGSPRTQKGSESGLRFRSIDDPHDQPQIIHAVNIQCKIQHFNQALGQYSVKNLKEP